MNTNRPNVGDVHCPYRQSKHSNSQLGAIQRIPDQIPQDIDVSDRHGYWDQRCKDSCNQIFVVGSHNLSLLARFPMRTVARFYVLERRLN